MFFLQKPAGFFSPFWNICSQRGWRRSFGFSFLLREWALHFLVNLFASLFPLTGFYVLYLRDKQSCKISIVLLLEMLVSSCLLCDIIGQPGKGSVSTHCYGAHCHLVLRRTYHLFNLMLPMRCQSFILMSIGRSNRLCKCTDWKVPLRDPPVSAVELCSSSRVPLVCTAGSSLSVCEFWWEDVLVVPCSFRVMMMVLMVLWGIIKDLHMFW